MSKQQQKTGPSGVIGVVPMAGLATRLDHLACSKEIHPVGPQAGKHPVGGRQQVVCEYVLEKMHVAGVTRIYVVLREGKWDIPACLGDGSRLGLHLGYLMMGLPYGTPYSFDQAYPFLEHATVAFGFPDMILGPEDMFGRLLEYRKTENADVVLGLFPADRPEKVDMVEVGKDGRVKQIIIKPVSTDLAMTWGIAVWTPVFTDFLHVYLAEHRKLAASAAELFVGDIVQAGIDAGLNVYGIQVSAQPFLDIGTRDDLKRALATPDK